LRPGVVVRPDTDDGAAQGADLVCLRRFHRSLVLSGLLAAWTAIITWLMMSGCLVTINRILLVQVSMLT
jgi:hypothetical protein